MSEQTDFLKDLEVSSQPDVLTKPLEESTETVENPEKEESAEDVALKAKNRRERRLVEQNQRLREEAIATSARLQALSESKSTRESAEPAEYLKRLDRIYGDATPEAKEATELLKEAFKGVHESARKEALDEAMRRFDEKKAQESEAERQESAKIDELLEVLDSRRR